MNRIGIIDVGIGNLGSLRGAVYELGADVDIVASPEDVLASEALILPGVGSFAHGMQAIESAGLRDAIRGHVADGRPLLGICLGMQLLFGHGDEGGGYAGLNLIPGAVRRFPERPGHHVPHVGWNDVAMRGSHPLWQGIKPGVDFYFVHSYRVECDAEYVLGETEYGETFPSAVAFANVLGVQFHPEKSQRNGLRLLENFCHWDGKC
jgi:glutamine amidotransferase